ncbi:hypothetical protein KAU33_06595 [Candidatus Dependentiae bacterium]|nr:hypothetical protein [Candidatus Dependentiae bacterium]
MSANKKIQDEISKKRFEDIKYDNLISTQVEKEGIFLTWDEFLIIISEHRKKNYVEIISRLDVITDLISHKVVNKYDMEKSTEKIITSQKNGFVKIENLIKENDELRKLLNDKYSVKTLFIITSLVSIILMFTVYVWFVADFPLIHPVLSIPLLIGSLSFAALSYWKMK